MKEFWNQRYSPEALVYGTEANEFFQQELPLLKPGKILMPAEGEGQNAIFAASTGWDVNAFDFSEVAKQKALKNAVSKGLTIDYHLSSWLLFPGRNDYYDAIGLFFFQLPSIQRRLFHSLLIEWLRPGGTIIAELFSNNQHSRNSGGPRNPENLYKIEDLEHDFSGVNIEVLREVKRNLNDGEFHQGEACILQLKARKPGR